ncbi:Uncharacterized protein Adt_14593 [Abeliophyllum distichum]|uniref:Uncharacterized protein n=1 Tax=Abeliophyllum distichum TaxID=126358 RepID=A0ABD1U037_9LAMI
MVADIVWMLFTSDQLILPAFDHSQHSQTQRAPLLRLQAAVKPIRERSDLLTPANASDSSLLLRHKNCPHILKEPYSAPPPPTILKDVKQRTMWIIGCGLFVCN